MAKQEASTPPSSQTRISDFVYDSLVEQSKAKADFYQGVHLLNSGNVAESLIALQRAVSSEPKNALMRYWLARAHSAYGQREFAHAIYKELIDADFNPTYLAAVLSLSRRMSHEDAEAFLKMGIGKAIRAVSLDISKRGYRIPMNARAISSGNLLMTALGSNILSIFNPITMSDRQFVKTATLLYRPMDAILLDNRTIVVSEFAGDTLSVFSYDGAFLGGFMQEPLPKNFSGPQFLAVDSESNIYVSTAGSRRIIKCDEVGTFLLEIGGTTHDDFGLSDPTGVAVVDHDLWVLDNQEKVLYLVRYDRNGNFIGRYLVAETRGESLQVHGQFLLLATENSVMVFDTKKLVIVDELKSAEFVKVTSATLDRNEMLWVVDQWRGRLEAFSEPASQYAGLRTRVLSLRTEDFPTLRARVSVLSASGVPIIGLGRENFVLFEDDVSATTMDVRPNDATIQDTNVVLIPILHGSKGRDRQKFQITESVEQLIRGDVFVEPSQESEQKGQHEPINFWVMKDSSTFGYELEKGNVAVQVVAAVKNAVAGPVPAPQLRSQLQIQTLRMAINTLLPIAGNKSVLFIGSEPEVEALESEAWNRMMELALENAISIIWVYVRGFEQQNAIEETTVFEDMLRSRNALLGVSSPNVFHYPYVIQNVHITLAERLRQAWAGVYTIAFESRYILENKQYDEKYVSFAVESYYFTRSGKDIGGYVIPLP